MNNTYPLARRAISLGLIASTLCLASCASGPTYAELKPKLPPIAKGQGRVFVYRGSGFGAAVQPEVRIDNRPIGISKGMGFIYSDQPAGSHEVSIMTEWKHKNSVSVISGQPSFVECMILPGFFVGQIVPNQVDAARGEAKIQNLRCSQK